MCSVYRVQEGKFIYALWIVCMSCEFRSVCKPCELYLCLENCMYVLWIQKIYVMSVNSEVHLCLMLCMYVLCLMSCEFRKSMIMYSEIVLSCDYSHVWHYNYVWFSTLVWYHNLVWYCTLYLTHSCLTKDSHLITSCLC